MKTTDPFEAKVTGARGVRATGEFRIIGGGLSVLVAACLLLAACGKAVDAQASHDPPAQANSADAGDKSKGKQDAGEKGHAKDEGKEGAGAKDDEGGGKNAEAKEGVELTAEQVEKLGVTTQPAQAVEYRAESSGYAVVLDHQLIAQAVADLRTAQATAHVSEASLERARGLHGTPGAMSADVEQTAEQKAAVDSAALTLTTQKLSSTWGMNPPWKSDIHDGRVQALARGDMQLVRVTFPLGSAAGTPEELHGGRVGISRPDATASMRPVWPAPADASIPGRSYFTLLHAGTAAEGERLQVWAPTGQPTSGALVPAAALVLSGGKYWCYVERTPGTFTRTEVDLSRPASGGYVVTDEIKPGDKIAVTAAGQLLAKETGSTEEPD